MTLKPLEGITIVEMGTTEAEGIATLLLSDYGAEVIRLEFPKKEQEENCQDFRICDRGKRRIRFRPDVREDRTWLEELLSHVDAVVTSVPDIRMSQWNLDVDTLCGRNPAMVYTSVTGYGQTGPYGNGRLYNEAAIQAESGFMATTGPEHGEPVRSGSDFATFAAAANACIGTLMALIDAQRTGRGRRIDVSMMDSILYGFENQFSVYLKSGLIPERLGNHYALSAPVGDFMCKDGRKIMISVATGVQWENFADVMGHLEWLENPDYRNVSARLKNHCQLEKEVSAAFLEYTSQELMRRLQTKKCIYGQINNFREVTEHEQVQARRMLIEIETPDGTKMTVPSNPLVMDGKKKAGTVINDTKMCHECDIEKLFLAQKSVSGEKRTKKEEKNV